MVADSVHGAHVAKVDTHPVGCVRDLQIAGADLFGRRFVPVSYTHLDVYKRQVDDCADAGAAKPISGAVIRIAKIRFVRMTFDKYFNTHLILSRQITLIENTD